MEAIKTIQLNQRSIDITALYHRIIELEKTIDLMNSRSEFLKVKTQEGIHIIPQEEIIRCQSYNNYTIVYLMDGRKICVSKTLKYIQAKLSEAHFIRVHASHLISFHEVRKISRDQGKSIILSNGESIPVSRTYRPAVELAFS